MNEHRNAAPATRAAFLAAGVAGAALVATGTADAAVDLHELHSALGKSARHRQVIAAPKVDQGTALRHAVNGLNAFEYAYGEGARSLHVVMVLYGSSVCMLANDRLWARYHLFDVLNNAGDGLPLMVHGPQNPFYRSDARAGRDDAQIQTLTGRGVSFVACNNALHTLARAAAASGGGDERAVYEEFVRNLVPGALVVPSGVAAIVLAQEAGYTYLG